MMRIDKKNDVEMSRFSYLSKFRDISHFITTRKGGVSSGNYGTMNPGIYTTDEKSCVLRNLEILASELGLSTKQIIMPHQTHGDRIFSVNADFLIMEDVDRDRFLNGVDSLITDVPGLCVAVSTADCVPLLLFSPEKKVVAAVHAGWRGTVLRIAQKTVQEMIFSYGCNPSSIVVGVGPSISQQAFEVGEEVVQLFEDAGFDLEHILWRNPKTYKPHVDLWEANRLQLLDAGLQASHIEISGICTYTHFDDYFSARRLGIDSGRILSGIFLNTFNPKK